VSEPLVFEAETPTGSRVRVVWDPAVPESVLVFTLTGDRGTWSRPLECQRVSP
jgi:hypothetical protein